MADLEAIRRRADAATAGPWEYVRAQRQQDGAWDYGIGAKIDGTKRCIAETFGRVADDVYPPVEANATFIAHARTDVPMLCDELASKDAEIADLTTRHNLTLALVEFFEESIKERDALLLTQAQEVWESAAKIADQFANTKADLSKSDNPYTANAIASIMSETGAKIAAAIRSRIPPSIGGDRAARGEAHHDDD